MREHDCVVRRRNVEYLSDPLVIQPIPVHGWKETHAPLSLVDKRVGQPPRNLPWYRIEHEEADEAIGMASYGSGDGGLVTRDAGDERGSRNAVPVELGRPPIGEVLGAPRIVPAELVRHRRRAAVSGEPWQVFRQELQKSRRKEVTMHVVEEHRWQSS